MFTRMPDDDPKWSSTGKLCTNGEWPCEMSTYIASIEKVNAALLEALIKIYQLKPICSHDCLLADAQIIAEEAIKQAEGK